jgi:hypothetical protein
MALRPTHLDTRDPARIGMGVREEVDREIEAYGDLAALVLLVPEDRWDEFLRDSGVSASGEGEARYRGVTLRRAAVTDVVVQEGF